MSDIQPTLKKKHHCQGRRRGPEEDTAVEVLRGKEGGGEPVSSAESAANHRADGQRQHPSSLPVYEKPLIFRAGKERT